MLQGGLSTLIQFRRGDRMNEISEFRLIADLRPEPAHTLYDADLEVELPPLLIALRRFKHKYFYSTAIMRAGDHEDHLELSFELAYALPQLPDWLERLAKGDQKGGLLFGSQGSERELIAERHGEMVT